MVSNIGNKLCLLFIISLTLGCSQVNNFLEYYNDDGLDVTEYIPLKANEEIEIIETMSLDERVKEYLDKGYIVLGNSYFQAQWCPRSLAIDTAKIKGASVVIISSRHLGDENRTYAIPYTQAHTTYHQGNINSSSSTRGSIYNNYGNSLNFNATTNGQAFYSGTSTYYTTDYITGSYTLSYYEQLAVFLAKKNNN